MLTDVMSHYGLKRGFRRLGFSSAFNTKQAEKVCLELTSSIKEGSLIVVSGIMGVGKTTTIRIVKERLNREKEIVVCGSLSLEKQKVTLVTLMTAVFNDLTTEKTPKIPSQAEKRERLLCDLIGKKQKPVALFVDEAHDLNGRTLTGLKRMIETVQEHSRGVLSIVLVGHPRLKNAMRRSSMEEVGARTEVIQIEQMDLSERKAYANWIIETCRHKRIKKISDIIEESALNAIAEKLSTPLQIEQTLEMAFEEGYNVGQKPITAEVIESVVARDLNDVEAKLARLGYNPQTIAEVLNIRRAEAKQFVAGKLSTSRNEEICKGLLAVGIPI
jgi:type II secretory pathway predicted ATPase ExeA